MEIIGIALLIIVLFVAVVVGAFRVIRTAMCMRQTSNQIDDLETRLLKDLTIHMKTVNSRVDDEELQTDYLKTYIQLLNELEEIEKKHSRLQIEFEGNSRGYLDMDLSKDKLDSIPDNTRSFIYEK